MLVPAILYKEEIYLKSLEYFYSDELFYYMGGLYNSPIVINDEPNEGRYQFAIINSAKELIGYMDYHIDYYSSNVSRFGYLSFDKGNIIVGRDAYRKIDELVNRFHRIEWRAIGGNPACKGYDSIIAKYGGNKHILKDAVKDKYGAYHDDIIYEIITNN